MGFPTTMPGSRALSGSLRWEEQHRRLPRSTGSVTLTAIGEITSGHEVRVVDENGGQKTLRAGG